MALAGINPEFIPLLPRLSSLVNDAYLTRYVTIISFTLAIYDGFMLFPYELRHIWSARGSIAKWAYLVNRYMSFAGMALLVRGTGGLAWGDMTDNYCRATLGIDLALGALSIGVANYLVLLKVWYLWDQRRMVIAVTTVAWIFSYIATLAVVGVAIHQLLPHTYSFAAYGINFCGALVKPSIMRGVWAAPIALEVLVFIFTVLNAAHRPRPADISLSHALYRDGILLFGSLFALRVFNLVVTILLPASLQFVGACLIWGVNQALLHRLILNQSVASAPRNQRSSHEELGSYDLDGIPGGGTDERFSFFDSDVFGNSPKRRRAPPRPWRDNMTVVTQTTQTQVTFMDSPDHEKGFQGMWKQSWRTVGNALDRAAAHTV